MSSSQEHETSDESATKRDRSCVSCAPHEQQSRCAPRSKRAKCGKAERQPLIVQCQSPLTHPPRLCVDIGQTLLAVETGQMYYYGKTLHDDDDDGDIDRCTCGWLPMKCGECAPISFRQSQIFFYDNFTGSEEVEGPVLDDDAPGKLPVVGDYLIDCIVGNLWTYTRDCEWQLIGKCFGGGAALTLQKTASEPLYNTETDLFEIHYVVTICNNGDEDFTSLTLTDDVRAQAEAAGLGADDPATLNVSFVPPTNLAFVNATFAGSGPSTDPALSNVLVDAQPLPAHTCNTVEYRVTAPHWILPAGQCTAQLRNLVTVVEAITDTSVDQSGTLHAMTSTTFRDCGGQARFTKRFGQAHMDNVARRVNVPVTLTIENTGVTPLNILSIVDDVQSALGGNTSFSSPVDPIARWTCGSGTLPTKNAAYNGAANSNLLGQASYTLIGGNAFAIDFALSFQRNALFLMTPDSPLCNVAQLSYIDSLLQSKQCDAQDKFFCDDCPRLAVDKTLMHVRPAKRRVNLYQDIPFDRRVQFVKPYSVELKMTFCNSGCSVLLNVRPYLNLIDAMVANGVVAGQLGTVYNQQVTIIESFPEPAISVTPNANYTGINGGLTSSDNRLVASNSVALLPGQGFTVCVRYDYMPSNNSIIGTIDVPAPSCVDENVSGALPAVQGDAALYVRYNAMCVSALQQMNLVIPIVSDDCPNLILQKTTERLTDLSNVLFAIDAPPTPGDEVLHDLNNPPPPTYNCYQATLKFKVTNSGNVPVDNVRICDDFFDQLNEVDGGGVDFCAQYVVKPPVQSAGPDSSDDAFGSFDGNAEWTATGGPDGDPYVAGGNGLLLPGTSLEFWVVVRFCIDPKITIRIFNDASVLARAPNEALVRADSRTFLPIDGPSFCFSKEWAPGYPLEESIGQFRGKLLFTIYNDGDRRLLDVQIFDQFANGDIVIDSGSIAPPGPAEQGVRDTVDPCQTITGESNFNVAWDGTDASVPVNTGPLPLLDRSERFTLETPEFTFSNNFLSSAVNTATVEAMTIYDNPARNVDAVLTDLALYAGYTGPGENTGFGIICRTDTLDVAPGNEVRECPFMLQPPVDAAPGFPDTATLIDGTPGAVLYTITWQSPFENSDGGSLVNVATIESMTITSVSVLPAGVTSQSISFVDPSPLAPGDSALLEWTETLLWTGTSGSPPTMSYSQYEIATQNTQNLSTVQCPFNGNIIALPEAFVDCPTAPVALSTPTAQLVAPLTPGAVLYDFTYTHSYTNDSAAPTTSIVLTPTTASYPSGVTPVSTTFVDPSPVAAGATVLLQWTERVQWNGTDENDDPPTMTVPTYDVVFSNTLGLNHTCQMQGTVPVLPDPFIACPAGALPTVPDPAVLVDSTPGAVLYDVTYQYFYANGNASTDAIAVTSTTAAYPADIISLGVTFVDPSPVAPGASPTLQWVERLQWSGVDNTTDPPAMPALTYDVSFSSAAGLDATCAMTGAPPTLPDPFP